MRELKCFNCLTKGHASYDCEVPFCRACNRWFASVEDPKYHKMNICPNSVSRGNDTSGRQRTKTVGHVQPVKRFRANAVNLQQTELLGKEEV